MTIRTLVLRWLCVYPNSLTAGAIAWAVGRAEVHEIDELNILQATLLAMRRVEDGLGAETEKVLVDANQVAKLECRVETTIERMVAVHRTLIKLIH